MPPRKRHRPVLLRYPSGHDYQQRCEVCEATRDMFGGKRYSLWLRGGSVATWCPGGPVKEA